jgi:hypothetical protein
MRARPVGGYSDVDERKAFFVAGFLVSLRRVI